MNLLITGAWKPTEQQLAEIKALGYSIVIMEDETGELPCEAAVIDAVICNNLFAHHSIERFSSLRYIQLTSAGYDRAPLEYIQKNGIEIYNALGVYSVPIAEFALSLVLQIYKQSDFFAKNTIDKKWQKHRGLRELNGKTVCIVGCGSIGKQCAKLFHCFGCRVIGVNRTITPQEYFQKIMPLKQLSEAVSESDVVILSVALTNETKHLINSSVFRNFKENTVQVNVSRGAVVHTDALIQTLQDKNIYAALDVFETEPLPHNSPLWEMENVILTPHNSFVSDGNAQRMFDVIFNNLRLLV